MFDLFADLFELPGLVYSLAGLFVGFAAFNSFFFRCNPILSDAELKITAFLSFSFNRISLIAQEKEWVFAAWEKSNSASFDFPAPRLKESEVSRQQNEERIQLKLKIKNWNTAAVAFKHSFGALRKKDADFFLFQAANFFTFFHAELNYWRKNKFELKLSSLSSQSAFTSSFLIPPKQFN